MRITFICMGCATIAYSNPHHEPLGLNRRLVVSCSYGRCSGRQRAHPYRDAPTDCPEALEANLASILLRSSVAAGHGVTTR